MQDASRARVGPGEGEHPHSSPSQVSETFGTGAKLIEIVSREGLNTNFVFV